MGKGMKVMLAALLTVLVLAPAAHAELTAESMYQPSTVVSIKLTLPEESIKKLEAEPEENYVEGTFSIAESNGTPTGLGPFSAPMKVGIRLKGSGGSFRNLSQKAAFKISFGKFIQGQTFLGLQKMTLNNMVQDDSMVHETLAYELFHANRVAGSHTGFAYLHVNLNGSEQNFGTYLNIETMDVVALEKRFGPFLEPPQHLYSGEYHSDVTAAKEGSFEVSEGQKKHKEDLEAIVAAVAASTPAGFTEQMAPYADLQEMVHEWAVEKYIDHWDGYAGMEGFNWPNNFYLYSSATGRFTMLPWGTDQTWGPEPGSSNIVEFDQKAGVLFNHCLENGPCRTMYLRALREVLASVPGVGPEALATRTAALLAPWQAMEESPRRQKGASEIHAAVESVVSFAKARPAELEAFLATEPAEKPAAHVAVSVQPATLPAGGGSGTVTATVTGAAGEPIFGDHLVFSAPGLVFGPVVDQGEGVYTATFSGAPMPGQVTITATDSTSGVAGTGTLTAESTAPAPGPSPSGGTGGSGGTKSTVVPFLTLRKVPRHRTTSRRPVFAFGSDVAGTTFVCRLGSASFRPCTSPVRLPRLSAGRHVFSIAPIGPEGTRGKVRRYEFVVSIRSRTRVPD
jgi:hypothetical protein